MKKPQRAPKGVKKVSFAASGSPDAPAENEERADDAGSESRDISETINDVIQSFCHNENTLDSTTSVTSPATVTVAMETVIPESVALEPVEAPPQNLPLEVANEQTSSETRMSPVAEGGECVAMVTVDQSKEPEQEEEEEVIDLIFDVDNDLVQEVNDSQPQAKAATGAQDLKVKEDENVILDLDNNTFVVNNAVIDIDQSQVDMKQIELQEQQLQATTSTRPVVRSSIIITKRNPPPSSSSSSKR